MEGRPCPVCNAPAAGAELFLEQNVDPSRLSEYSFASRKLPEYMSHKLVRCPTCDLVYVATPPDQSVLAEAYHESAFDSAEEAADAAAAYDEALEPVWAHLQSHEAALEIGTGTGVFLDILKSHGFSKLVGVEPSAAAIAAAPAHRKDWINHGIFRESDFAPESFDMICCFMTLEHVRDPQEIISAAYRLLRPAGVLAVVTHDYRSWVNKLLGTHSPIIDIEHMQLFSVSSIKALLQHRGFEGIQVTSFRNKYPLRYWIRLLPIRLSWKLRLLDCLEHANLGSGKLGLNVGNMLAYAYRPDQ